MLSQKSFKTAIHALKTQHLRALLLPSSDLRVDTFANPFQHSDRISISLLLLGLLSVQYLFLVRMDYYISLGSLKACLLFLASCFYFLGLAPPNPPPRDKGSVYKGQLFEKTFKFLIYAGQTSTLLAFLGNILLLSSRLSHQPGFSATIVPYLCPHPSPSLFHNLTEISTSFLVGIVALLWGSCVRLWCFHTLGRLFTYEVSIQTDHELITSGPYAIVRHPSYTGLVVMLAGAAITSLSSGSYIQECNLMSTNAKWFIGLWLISAVFVALSLWNRGEVEDIGLEKNFGEVWRRYSETVIYRFIPYLI